MSTDRDITRIVRSWLGEGATSLPDRVLDNVFDQLPATPQRRAWWPAWRLTEMNPQLRIALAAAAIVVVAVIGIYVLPGKSGVGGPAATASPAITPSPGPSGVVLTGADVKRPLAPGTYRVAAPFAAPFSLAFGSQWTPSALAVGDANFTKTTPANGGAGVAVDLVEKVFADPCHTKGGPTKPPSTVDGIVAALTNMVGFSAGPVTDAVIGGRPAKTLVLTNAIDTTTANCTGGPMLPLWTFRGGPASGAATNGGLREELWVLDVNGTIVVIDGNSSHTTSSADRLEIETIVGSLSFE